MRRIVWVLLFLSSSLHAQVLTLPAEPEKFIEEYSKQMQKHLGKDPEFAPFFRETLQADAQKQSIRLLSYLSKKGLKPIDLHGFTQILQRYYQKTGQSQERLIEFLGMMGKTAEFYPAKYLQESFAQLNAFLSQDYLYTSTFNKIRASWKEVRLQYLDKKQDYFSGNSGAVVADAGLGWDDTTGVFQVQTLQLPQTQGLLFVFDEVDLALLSPSDSLVISKTKGAYNFMESLFIGEGGEVSWEVQGKAVKGVPGKYSYKGSTGRLLAEKATLTHEGLLEQPVQGVLEIKMEKRSPGTLSSYPRFKSYENSAKFLLPLDDYEMLAGYTLQGQSVSTASLKNQYTRLRINKSSDTKQFEVIGKNILITDSLYSSDRVSFVARLGKDSVSHPGIMWTYDLLKQEVKLNKVRKGGFRNSMFSDTFHQVDIRCDAMSWDLNSGKMDFYIVAGKQEVAAEFESFDYFNSMRLGSLSNVAGFNPLMAATTLVNRKKINRITVDELQQFIKKERHFADNGLLIGTQMGFFDYHPFEDYYSISRKGFHYFLVATGKKDYDDLVFSSLNKGADKNASIDFNSKSLDIAGAQNFKLSDSLGIQLLPDNQSMQVIGNKVFQFTGKMIVKNYTFYGDFVLEYENFLVNLQRIDSITFTPLELYKKGSKMQLGRNFAFGKTGKLLLNAPDNKSGRKKLPEYPKLEIPGGMSVAFQHMDKDFHFKADKLQLDSLNAKDPQIPGLFTLGKIFKPIKDELRMLPDSSMGLLHTARSPYPVYGLPAAFIAQAPIELNKRGLYSKGEIQHLTSKLQTDFIQFLPEKAIAQGKGGSIQEKQSGNAYFPQVNLGDYRLDWSPLQDSLAIASEKGFEFYQGSSFLKGSLVIRTTGLYGNGSLHRADSDITSETFRFDKKGFLASKAEIKVKGEGGEQLAFSGRDVDLDFQVELAEVSISAEGEGFGESGFLEFPASQYKTTIDKALWKIKGKTITMEGNLEGSVFTSTAQNQYGLSFHGTSAKYDIAAKKLSMAGVDEIRTADAAVIPADGNVYVQADGKLNPFENATIVADTLNRYHTLTNASVQVHSKLSYSGNADYRYVNISSDTFNIKLGGFEFAEITPEGRILSSKGSGKLSTIAHAQVQEKDQVYLANKMLYIGELTMLAPFKNLSLKGQILPDLKKYPMIGGSWINYSGSKSENVSIPIDETLKDGGKPLYVGLHLKYGANSDGLYPSFLSMKKSADDADIFLSRGALQRDEENLRYVVKTAADTDNTSEFYDEEGRMVMKGRFNLLGAPSKVFETVGKGTVLLDSSRYSFSTLMTFDFPLPIPTVQKMGGNVVKFNLDAGNTLAAIDWEDEDFVENLQLYLGREAVEKYRATAEKGHTPMFKESSRFLKSLVLSKVNLEWNSTANAYYSKGPIGVSNMGDVDINALVNGYVEVVQSHSTGNEIHVYLEISPTVWYYYVYRNGQLGMVTADEEVNKLLNTGKEKTVSFVDVNEASRFKKRFLTSYLGMSEEEFNKAQRTPAKAPKKAKKEEGEGF
jgi:hypothetical protein